MNRDEIAIEFRDVSFTLPTGKTLLAHLNLQVARGETLVLLGRSGSGKTTTMKLINRLIDPTSGQVDRRRQADGGLGSDPAAPAHRLRDPRDRPVPASDHRTEHRRGAAAGGLGAGTYSPAGARVVDSGRSRRRPFRRALPARTLRRPAPAHRRRPSPGRRSAGDSPGRAVRRPRSDHSARIFSRNSKPCSRSSARPWCSSPTTSPKPSCSAIRIGSAQGRRDDFARAAGRAARISPIPKRALLPPAFTTAKRSGDRRDAAGVLRAQPRRACRAGLGASLPGRSCPPASPC